MAARTVRGGSGSFVRRSTSQSAARRAAAAGRRVITEELERRVLLSGDPAAAVSGFVLVDARKDVDLFAVTDGMRLETALLPDFSLRAGVGGAVTAVQFDWQGTPNYRTDDSSPFSIAGDTNGDYKMWWAKAGWNVVTATPFHDEAGVRVAGESVTVNLYFYSDAPTKVKAVPVSYGQVQLTWKDVSRGEIGYVIDRSANGADFQRVASLPKDSDEWADASASPGVKYEYRVAAVRGDGALLYGDSSTARISTDRPATPTQVTAAPAAYYQIDVKWTDQASNEQGFTVQRSTDGATFETIGTAAPQTTKYSDATVRPGTTYYYRVAAFNPAGATAFAAAAAGARPYEMPPYFLRPSADSTGATDESVLTSVTGGLRVTQPGAVIENLRVTGTIEVLASNVTIRNVVVDANDELYGINCNATGVTGTVIQDVEVYNADSTGVVGEYYTARRLDVHDVGSDGFKAGDTTVIESCWVHRIGMNAGSHPDAVQISGGWDIVIRGNCFDVPVNTGGASSNSAVFIKPDFGSIKNVLIEQNWMNGGGFTVFLSPKVLDDGTVREALKVVVRGNYFGRDYGYGVGRLAADTLWDANFWADTGAPLPL